MELVDWNPKFKAMYLDIYEMCMNMERMVEMYSKELAELDRNTIRYMMDEMQEEIDQQKEQLNQQNELIRQLQKELEAERKKTNV